MTTTKLNGKTLYPMEKKHCIKLIKLFGSHKALWHSDDPDYRNKMKRDQAWISIHEQMQTTHTLEDLKKKMECLQGSYRRERCRVRRSAFRHVTGSIKKKYEPQWYAFKHFDFLRKKETRYEEPEFVDSHEKSEEESSSERNEALEDNVTAGSIKREPEDDNVNNLDIEQYSIVELPSSEPESKTPPFAKHVGLKLMSYSPYIRSQVEYKIATILHEADMGDYNKPYVSETKRWKTEEIHYKENESSD